MGYKTKLLDDEKYVNKFGLGPLEFSDSEFDL
jgi:hypothetical protein